MNAWALGLPLAVLLPLLLIPGFMLRGLRRAALALAPWSAAPALLFALAAPVGVALELPSLLFGTRFAFDATAQVFLRFGALLWLVAGVYARSYLAHDVRYPRFMVFHLATMSGSLGLIVAHDVASFYFFFSLMTFAAYGLIVHEDTRRARHAGRVYLVLAVIGEALLFAGALLAVAAANGDVGFPEVVAATAAAPLRPTIIALMLAGFGIKAGMLLLHVWLPLAHPVAPTPASAILSGVLIKAGLLGWMRLIPAGETALPAWSGLLIAIGLAAAFYAVGIGLTQRDPKTVLAYSSVSQMGLMTMLFGTGLAAPQAWSLALPALLVFAMHHGLAKGALFLGAGLAAGAGWRRALWLAGLALPALALAGAPFTSGVAAKSLFLAAAALAPAAWPQWLGIALPLSSIATTLLLSRFMMLVARTPGATHAPGTVLWLSWLAVVLAGAVAIWWFLPAGARSVTEYVFSLKGVWGALWPVLTGVVLAVGVTIVPGRRMPQFPAGDVLVWLEWRLLRVRRRTRGPRRKLRSAMVRADKTGEEVTRVFARLRVGVRIDRGEAGLRVWEVAGAAFLLLSVLLFALLVR